MSTTICSSMSDPRETSNRTRLNAPGSRTVMKSRESSFFSGADSSIHAVCAGGGGAGGGGGVGAGGGGAGEGGGGPGGGGGGASECCGGGDEPRDVTTAWPV